MHDIYCAVNRSDKPLAWLHGKVDSPPFRVRHMPHSRPMPSIGVRCHELRVNDSSGQWRLIYRIDSDAIVIAEIFAQKSAKTPKALLDVCRQRLKEYDDAGR